MLGRRASPKGLARGASPTRYLGPSLQILLIDINNDEILLKKYDGEAPLFWEPSGWCRWYTK